MVMLKIMIFYTLLPAFFIVSWLWHWVWFGSGSGFVANRLVPWIIFRSGDRRAAASVVETVIKVSLFVLVAADLVGLYLVIYSLLG